MPKIPQYTKEQLDNALEEIYQGIPIRVAAKKYGIPRATLQFKLKKPNSKHVFGPNPYLTTEEEKHLEVWICEMGRRGFPRSAEDILDSVQNFLTQNPRETPFVDNRPGKGWLKGFLKRHPRITQRTGEAVSHASACVTEKDIRKWFSEVTDLLKQSGLESILEDPSRIYNADESGFQTCPTTGRVFAERGEKNVYIIDKGKAKENMTVLFAISADGENILPTIVYPYQRLPERIKQSVPDEWGIATSSSGWMKADTFKYIIEHVFYPFLVKKNITFPVLLFVDGHKSHLTYDLSLLAHSLQIEIIALYPNATRILQPADVSLFRPVKQFWKAAVREWMLENDGEVVTRQNFANVLKKVIRKINPLCIVNGFRACGLYPFNPDAIDYSKCIAKATSTTKQLGEQTLVTPEISMPFSKFKEIVGTETLNQFKQIKQIIPDIQNNEHFFILYQLWDYYKQNKLEVEIADEPNKETESIFNEIGELETRDTEKETKVPETETQEDETVVDIVHDEWLAQEKEMTVDLIGNPETRDKQRETEDPDTATQINGIVIDIDQNEPLADEREITVNKTVLSVNGTEQKNKFDNLKKKETRTINTITITAELHTLPTRLTKKKTLISETGIKVKEIKQNNFNTKEIENNNNEETFETEKISHADLLTLEDLGVQNEYPSCKQSITKSNLKDFLRIPTEPARKGKRNILRLPYHISGPDYQRILEEKAKEKENLEKEKRERKIEREQKREDRKRKAEEKKTAKIKKCTKTVSVSNQTCNICEKLVKYRLLVCSECHRVFHKSCVPKSHRQHIPEEEGDSYLCHNCYSVTECTDVDDMDEEISNDTDDDFLSNLKERQTELGLKIVNFH